MTTIPFELPTTPHETEGPDNDGFFTDLVNTKPYLKMAFEGFAASGKTFTMVNVAIGLHQLIGSKKKIIYFDTEKASKFAKKAFADAGIGVLVRESRSPADLVEAMKRCRDGLADILITDSLSHIWETFVEEYKAKHRKTRLEMLDWGVIKPTWKKEIMDPFVNDPYHYLFTGRAGYEYENEINPETKKREIFKSGIKMKVEGETAYEPDILVLMERYQEVIGNDRGVWREAMVLKDRANLIDGKVFKNPTFEVFAPSIKFVLENAGKASTVPERDTKSLFVSEEDKRIFLRTRDIALEKIEGELVAKWPGQTADAKRLKVEALEHAFGTKSWTQVSGMRPEDLDAGLGRLIGFIKRLSTVEKVESDLLAVWPGTSDEAKGLRAAALEFAFGTKSLTEVQGMELAELTPGQEGLTAYIRDWQTAAGVKAAATPAVAPPPVPAPEKAPRGSGRGRREPFPASDFAVLPPPPKRRGISAVDGDGNDIPLE